MSNSYTIWIYWSIVSGLILDFLFEYNVTKNKYWWGEKKNSANKQKVNWQYLSHWTVYTHHR